MKAIEMLNRLKTMTGNKCLKMQSGIINGVRPGFYITGWKSTNQFMKVVPLLMSHGQMNYGAICADDHVQLVLWEPYYHN